MLREMNQICGLGTRNQGVGCDQQIESIPECVAEDILYRLVAEQSLDDLVLSVECVLVDNPTSQRSSLVERVSVLKTQGDMSDIVEKQGEGIMNYEF